jgi:nucleotide-binding universal stress UspA family protein
MTRTADNRPVVVGVDGSQAALDAALWAVDEAIDRETPLRLVHATGIRRLPSVPADVYRPELHYGEAALRAASSAVTAIDKTVKLETEILWDSPTAALLAESRSAAMMCLGTAGIGWVARRVLGSTAAALAEKAQCPIVLVRHQPDADGDSDPEWVVVGVDRRDDNNLVVTRALEEARVRKAPVLAVATWSLDAGAVTTDELEHRVAAWRRRFPDIHIYPVTTGASLARFLADNHTERVQLAVVGTTDADQVAPIVGPHDRELIAHANCSVMVVR